MKKILWIACSVILVFILGFIVYVEYVSLTQTGVTNPGNVTSSTSGIIRVTNLAPNQSISSPLVLRGEARGSWFFEASFPIVVTDWDGRIIAQGIAQAKSDWMTNDFVPFEATIPFTVDPNVYSNRGAIILQKDNPSGLPQNDDALEIPIFFAGFGQSQIACTQEARLCPDGSAVGRSGPNCEFDPCPTK